MGRSLRRLLPLPGLLPVSALPALLLAGCIVPVGGGSGDRPGAGARQGADPVTTDGTCARTQGHLALERIDAIRREHGLRPFEIDERLVRAAVAHTADQAARGPAGVGHIGSDGSAPGDRVTAAGYAWVRVAENVAAGMASPATLVTGWMHSPPHRATILSPEAVHAGIGYVHRPDGRANHYWTLLVAAPREGSAARVLACHP